ncbi:E3 SUMO-protein ligase NSE2-like isoform X2 [Belonocnema kinseyi]|uniref:E3 SUMO-protein ligase NSE2-like isoform X2 n=1 Tax=Belonocnema kinseyi TaxID=2817044 RepID=UPI00143D4D0B|nr:E3 SUMO-protein ligase NSE2-like isoform X2 [Belonocnema kinseyi]
MVNKDEHHSISIKDCNCGTKDALHGEEQNKVIEEMKDIVEKNCFVNAKLTKANEVIERITELHSSDDNILKFKDILEEYKTEMVKIDPDVSRDINLVEFNRQVKDLLKDTENASDAQPLGDSDDDLQFTQDTVNVIDPFTKKRMTDPMKNKTCGHVYDRKSVNAMLKVNPRTRCPVVGCAHKEYISINNLESDIVLKTRLLKKTV